MAATVKIGPWEATCDGYQWEGEDAGMVACLNSYLSPDGPSGSDPNPDLTAAREAVERLGGAVLRFDESARSPGRVY